MRREAVARAEDAQALGQQQAVDLARKLAEAILEFGAQGVEVLDALRPGHAAEETELLPAVADPFLGNAAG